MLRQTFTGSDGPEAGQAIEALVADMLGSLGHKDMHVFLAVENEDILGGIIFTRLTYDQDERTVFILAPVAVSTGYQAKGLGRRLIAYGLETLRNMGVDTALTYGDVNFYSKVGFHRITETEALAPLPLQYPEGWLGQSLISAQFVPLIGPSRCVSPLNNPVHWYCPRMVYSITDLQSASTERVRANLGFTSEVWRLLPRRFPQL